MKAAVIKKYGKPDVITIQEIIKPEIKDGEILVNVKAASVNPIDAKIRSGNLRFITGKKFPRIIGSDFSGVVAESKHTDYEAGDEVFGMVDWLKEGSNAEYITAKPNQIAKKPKNIDFFKSAAISLVGATTIQIARQIDGKISSKSILVNGCSGGVGSHAVQIFKAMGAEVTGVCSTHSFEFAKKLGLDNIIDYKKMDIYTSPKYDVVYDTIGNIDSRNVKAILNDGGTFLSLVPSPFNFLKRIIYYLFSSKKAVFYSVIPEHNSLKELATLLEKKLVIPVIDKVFTTNEIPEAHKLIETGHVKGKLVIIWA